MTFDPAKNDRNITERGLSFDRVADLEWETALAREDTRKDHGERRLRVLAPLGKRLTMVVIPYRDDAVHVISVRNASEREAVWFEKERR
jgi:uncharacterized DUF497 family protein